MGSLKPEYTYESKLPLGSRERTALNTPRLTEASFRVTGKSCYVAVSAHFMSDEEQIDILVVGPHANDNGSDVFGPSYRFTFTIDEFAAALVQYAKEFSDG